MSDQASIILSPEEIRRREFWQPCQTKEELYLHIKTFLDIDVPRYTVDEMSTSSALDFVWSVYSAMHTNSGYLRHVVATSRNCMKCNAEGTLVATPFGPREIQTLKIGDTVYDENGNPIKVIGVWDQGEQECIDLIYNNITLVSCTPEHPFLINTTEVKKVKDWQPNDILCGLKFTIPVKSIKVIPAGKKHCWDITVDSPTSLYCLQNGLVTHNTLMSAVIHFYAMIHFRRDCVQMAAIKPQSAACIKYLDKFLMIPEVAPYADINNKDEKILRKLPANSFTDKKDAKVLVVVGTLKGTNSARGSCLISDEVELIDPDILSEAANIADPTMKEGFDPISIYLSSRKFANGPLQVLIDDAENPKENTEPVRLHKWSLADFMKKCPESIHKPELPKIKAAINRDTLEILWEHEAEGLESKGGNYIEVNAYAGCRKCGAFVVCQSRTPKQQGTSPTLRTPKFVTGRVNDVRDVKKIIAQILNWKPESTGLVYPMFSPAIHVKTALDSYKWISHGEPFNPMKLTDEAYQFCLKEGDSKERALVIPTKKDLYALMERNGWKIHWGIDWGYTDPACLVVMGYQRKEHRVFLLHAEARTGYSNQDWANYVCVTYGKIFAPDLICPDMADGASPTYFSKQGFAARDTKPRQIDTGVSQMRSLLWNVATQKSHFCMLEDRLHAFVIEEFQNWTHARTPTGYDFDKFEQNEWNHFCDSSRYALDPFVEESDVYFAAKQKKETNIGDLFDAAKDGTVETQIALAKKQFEEYFAREHGIPNIFANTFTIPFSVPVGQPLPSFELNQKFHEKDKKKGGFFFKF